jgi:hypothetical protein
MLAMGSSYRDYTGVDSDAVAITWAKEHVSPFLGHCRFMSLAEFEEGINSQKSETVLSIEHLRNPERHIRLIRDSLAAHGCVVLSTPNGARTRHRKELFWNPTHVDEYDCNELLEILSPIGGRVQLYKLYRSDRLDWLMFQVSRLRNRGDPAMIPRVKSSGIMWGFTNKMYHRWMNRSWFYRITPLPAEDFMKTDFLSIIATIKL